jgi:hypothetical protein
MHFVNRQIRGDAVIKVLTQNARGLSLVQSAYGDRFGVNLFAPSLTDP